MRHATSSFSALALVLVGAGGTFGCAVPTSPDVPSNAADAAGVDAGGNADADAKGAPSGEDAGTDSGPAFPMAAHPAMPQMVNNNGPVLHHPHIVVVTFDGDDLRGSIEDFVTKLAPSSYWATTTSEYGVGEPVVTTIHQPAPAEALDDTQISAWLAAKIASDAAFKAMPEDALYALFYPQGTAITAQSVKGCQTFGGYHLSTLVAPPTGSKTLAAYAVVPRCQAEGFDYLDTLTLFASHELIEAATDPYNEYVPAFVGIAAGWEGAGGGTEAADLCIPPSTGAFVSPHIKLSDVGYVVQPSWSNAAAAAGHDPCQPSTGAFFGAAAITADLIANNGTLTQGIRVPMGTSKTVDVALFSDSARAPWTVKAVSDGQVIVTLDTTIGNNGDHLHLTVKNMSSSGAPAQILLQSIDGTVKHDWFTTIGFDADEAAAPAPPANASRATFACDHVVCPNDPPHTPETIQSCQAGIAGSCGAAGIAYEQCLFANTPCDAYGRSDDTTGTRACESQAFAYGVCAVEQQTSSPNGASK